MTRRVLPSRPQAQNFLLLAVVLLFLLGVSELVLRKLYPEAPKPQAAAGWAIIPESSWIEYDATLGWTHQRNTSSSLKKNGQTVPVSLNSKGYRGTREYADYKKPGSFRILAAGDSFTFGFGVHDNETFPAQMEALDPSLEVLNLGVAGYGVDQIYLSAQRELSETHPDLVLISVYPEDFWRATRAFNDAGYGKPYFSLKDGALELRHVPVPRDKNFSTVQFPDLIGKSPLEKFLMNSALYRVTLKAMIRLQKMLGLEDPDSSPEWVLGRVILSHMVHDLKRAGVPAVLVIVPPQRWLTGTVEPVRDSMLRFANREGIDAVDLTPVFQKAFAEKPAAHWYITDDLHWTAAGNRLVAQTLVDYLKNKSLLKAS